MGVEIKVIANSHAHLDHILGARGVKNATNAKFLLHPGDHALATMAGEHATRMLGQPAEPPPAPDASLADGDDVEVDGLKLRVIYTPGHTPGSVSFYTDGLLFSGDTLFRGSIGRTDLPGGDYALEMSSIVDKLLTLPDDTVVLPGHMQETQIGHGEADQPVRAGGAAAPPGGVEADAN